MLAGSRQCNKLFSWLQPGLHKGDVSMLTGSLLCNMHSPWL